MSIRQDTEFLLREKYKGKKCDAFFADAKRLALGEPLAYLIGHVPFLSTTIYLDSRPLIPRTETEFWVEKAIAEIERSHIPIPRILDLCAGSGCIGVAVAKAIPQAIVDFSEIDEIHIPTIKRNIEQNNINKKRVTVAHTSLFSGLPHRYDFILSNPPYIDETLHRVDESVKDFEPYIALFGGQAGLEVISQIIEQAPEHLTPGGQLWMEHEPEQSAMISVLADRQQYIAKKTHRDQYGTERYSTLVVQ
jgi:release factor glutamine methyltransferase